ncbi:MAG: zinc-dependent metalloprotease family protein [Bacteroidota bacterium]|nr:zinc-dependent metalloprotease family protein [Bacteroidota bacterium]
MMVAPNPSRALRRLTAAALLTCLYFAPMGPLFAQAAHTQWTQTHESVRIEMGTLLRPVNTLSKAVSAESPAVIARQVPRDAFAQLRVGGDITVASFPLPNGALVDLDLRAFALFNEQSIILSKSSAGEIRRGIPDVRLYRGRVRGEMASFAYLAVEAQDMTGSVTYRGKEYTISTRLEGLPTVGDRIVNVFEATDAMKSFECNVDDDAFIDDILRGMATAPAVLTADMDTLEAKLAVEIDYTAFKHYGGVSQSENYMTSLLGYINAIYERDVAVTFTVSYMRTWETEDPYSNASDDAALNTFTDYWRDTMGDVDRTLASLVTRKPISANGVTQGLAWVNKLCSKTHGYAFVKLSSNNANYEGHAGVWAHELGHNFGSPHTHACVWNPPIDSCYTAEPVRGQAPCFGPEDIHLIQGGGELMSYCHMRFGNSNVTKEFRDRTGALLRGNSERALCMNVTSTVRSLTLLTPTGGESLCAGTTMEVTWDAQGNNDFSILLSVNDGASYDTVLVADLPRYERRWEWTVPSDFPVGTTYRLRIVDNKLAELQDEMDASFEVREGTVITDQVKWRNVCVGEGAWFYVRATGAGALTYQWKRNGATIEGATTDELQLQNLQTSDNLTTFTCEITGDCGTIESEPALLKVFTSAVIVKDIENDTTCLGGSGRFEIEAEGSNLSYKWFFRSPQGVNKTYDVNSPVFTITDAKQEDFGAYWCEVNSTCGKTTGKTKFLIVPATSVEVLAPNRYGQVVPAGSQFTVAWKQYCLATVKIEVSTDNGTNWTLITGGYDASAGEYLWNVPTVDADQCLLRISDAGNPAISARSPLFKIKDVPIYRRDLATVGFSWVAVGSSAESSLRISNIGRTDLNITSTTLKDVSGGAMATVTIKNGAPFTVPPAGTYDLTLEFTPTEPVPVEGRLIIAHNANGSPDTVAVIGEGFVSTTSTDALAQPGALLLSQNYPNPVSLAHGAQTQIVFELARAADVDLALYNMLGQRVRLLFRGAREAGSHVLGADLTGIAPGVYMYRLTSGGAEVSRVLQLVR